MKLRIRLILTSLVALSVPLSACSKDGRSLPATATANISAYNHTGDYIDEITINGYGAGNSRAYGGGGSFACCIVYPRQWRGGLTATVSWATSSSDPNLDPSQLVVVRHTKVVPIDRYEETGTRLNVHFLPDEQVRLIMTNMTAGAPGYPGPDAPEPPPDWPPWKKRRNADEDLHERIGPPAPPLPSRSDKPR